MSDGEHTAHVEMLANTPGSPRWVGLLRVYGPGKNFKDRDPYEWSCVTRGVGERAVELLGVDKPVTLAIGRAIQRCLLDLEVDTMVSERFNTGTPRRVVVRRRGRCSA